MVSSLKPFSLCFCDGGGRWGVLGVVSNFNSHISLCSCLSQVSVVDELGIPVKFVGVGERVEDLQPFDAEAFVNAILS